MRIVSGAIKATPTEWLPVLANIAPPDLRREAATSILLMSAVKVTNLPLLKDMLQPPPTRLSSRHPVWRSLPESSFQIETAWRRRWATVDVPNKVLVADPNQALPGETLPRGQWVLLNRLRCRTGPCRSTLHKWGLRNSPLCDCGELQTMEHISDECRLTKFAGGIAALHEADETASAWLQARLDE